MAINRRSTERRRRVLYQAHVAPHAPSTPADRRAAEQLRAARQPAGAFGSRVNRHLRGRWFSLVPVSPLAISLFTAAVIGMTLLLTGLHHMAITSPSLAYREPLARPLRLDRGDSFGAFWLSLVLILSAGVAYLIYGLRLHRRDDYRGHYQLWRWTTLVLFFASIHQSVGLVSWMGAILELGLGDRAVLSGANWLRIVLDVGGIILAMRLVAEVYRCRRSLVTLLIALAVLGWSELVAWKIAVISTPLQSTLYIAAPMIAGSGMLLAMTLYLRALFRQVRGIADGPPLRERLRDWWQQLRQRDDDDDWELRLVQATEDIVSVPPAATRAAVTRRVDDASDDESVDDQPAADQLAEGKKLGGKSRDLTSDSNASEADEGQSNSKSRRSLLQSLRLGWLARLRVPRLRRPGRDADVDESKAGRPAPAPNQPAPNQPAGEETDQPRRSGFGLRWFKRRRSEQAESQEKSQKQKESGKQSAPVDTSGQSTQDPADETPKRKRPWFSLRLKPQRIDDSEGDHSEGRPSADSLPRGRAAKRHAAAEDSDSGDDSAESKPGWIARWFRRGKGDQAESAEGDAEASESGNAPPSRSRGPLAGRSAASSGAASSGAASSSQAGDSSARRSTPQNAPGSNAPVTNGRGSNAEADAEDDEDLPHPDDIDWNSMSKAERRRMRKRLKRSGHAA